MSATAAELASLIGGRVEGDGAVTIERLGSLDDAREGTLAFARSERYAASIAHTLASAVLVTEAMAVSDRDPGLAPVTIIRCPSPDFAMAVLLERFGARPRPTPGVHPEASVHPDAVVDASASIGPCAVVEAGASVGAGTVVGAGVVIGDGCRVGAGCILHAGVVIGADGFGYTPHPEHRVPVKLPHIGTVVIADHVEIGANTCVDRGKFGATTIGEHTKIDNLCQIAHNCVIGRACIICGQTALSGSVTLGDGVTLAGSVAIADNVTIGRGATVAARSAVMNDIPPGETWLGTPAHNAREAAANYAVFRHLAEHLRKFRRLEKSLKGVFESAERGELPGTGPQR